MISIKAAIEALAERAGDAAEGERIVEMIEDELFEAKQQGRTDAEYDRATS